MYPTTCSTKTAGSPLGFVSPPCAGIATSATPTTATTVTTKATTEPTMTPRDTRGSFPEALILQVGAEVVSGRPPGGAQLVRDADARAARRRLGRDRDRGGRPAPRSVRVR